MRFMRGAGVKIIGVSVNPAPIIWTHPHETIKKKPPNCVFKLRYQKVKVQRRKKEQRFYIAASKE